MNSVIREGSSLSSISKEHQLQAFEAIYINLSVGIILLNLDGTFQFVNPAFCNMLGYDHNRLKGSRQADVTHWDDQKQAQRLFDELKAGAQSQGRIEKRYISDDGTILWTDEWLSVMTDGKDKPELVIGVVQDIDEKKQAQQDNKQFHEALERKVEERTAQLKSAMDELESFSYSVSHDLRAPLRAVAGYASILEDDYADKIDEEGKKILQYVIDNTHKMGDLIDDLLSFSKMGRQKMQLQPLDIEAMAQDTIQEIKQGYTELPVSVDIQSLPAVYGDASLIRHVLQNLLGNAIKFSSKQDNAKIVIDSHDEPHETIISISDNGVGFDMKYYDKIFGVFQRLHGEDEFKGTGVGLALVQRIIHQHGGRIWAESKVGQGATFYFSLPKNQEEQ